MTPLRLYILLVVAFVAPVFGDEWVPECYRFRRDITISSSSSGFIDILLQLDSSSLIAAGKLLNCRNYRFRQPGATTEWLSFWWESSCDIVNSRVWITPEFNSGPVNIEVYYGCRDSVGNSISPPAGYGTEDTSWTGHFYVLSDSGCLGGWTDVTASFMDSSNGLYVRAITSGTFRAKVTSNPHDVHAHTTSSRCLATTMAPRRVEFKDRAWAAMQTHTHSLDAVTISSPNAFPPFHGYVVCESQQLDVRTNNIVMMAGSYSGLASGWRRYDEGDGWLVGVSPCPSGVCVKIGEATHRHYLSGQVGVNNDNERADDENHASSAKRNHVHDITPVYTDSCDNWPDRIPTVLAQWNSAGFPPRQGWDGDIMVFVDELPPRGWRLNQDYDDVYIVGAANRGSRLYADSTHVHTASVYVRENDISYMCGHDHDENWADDDHGHGWASYVSDPGPDPANQVHVDAFVAYYKADYQQNGITYNGEIGFECGGVYWDDPLVCSGEIASSGGVCYGENGTCICNRPDLWIGSYCQIEVQCGGYDWSNPLVCYQRGDCSNPQICYPRGDCTIAGCDCDQGYTGDICEISPCFGIPSDDPAVCGGVGVCWDTDRCMCFPSYHGMECFERFPYGTVLLSGETGQAEYSFFIPYVVPWDKVPSFEMPPGTPFMCKDRFFKRSAIDVVGDDAFCFWVNATEDDEYEYSGVFVNVTGTSPICSMKKVELEMNLLTTVSLLLSGSVDVLVQIVAPEGFGPDEVSAPFFTPTVTAVFVSVIVLLVIFALIVIVIGVTMFLYFRKVNKDSQDKLFDKIREMENAQHMIAVDREKLELAVRLQKLKSERPDQLPDTFKQLTTLDDECKVVLLETLGTDKVWRRCSIRRCVWQGHELVSRKLDLGVSRVTRKCINSLIVKCFAWSAVSSHPNIRRFHAYFVEGLDVGIVKAEATGPRLLQTFAQEYDAKSAAPDPRPPDHAILIESLEGYVDLLDLIRSKRRDARSALPGLRIRTAVVVEDKIKWLSQAALALAHLHAEGVVLRDFGVHNLLVKGEDLKIDMPFLTRPPERSPFAAPEVIADAIGRRHGEIGPAADVYSFGMACFCVLNETTRPYGLLRRRLKGGETIGQRVLREGDKFRPMVHPWLPSWTGNVLRMCWCQNPADRVTMADLARTLSTMSGVLGMGDEGEFLRNEDPLTDSDDWHSSEVEEESL